MNGFRTAGGKVLSIGREVGAGGEGRVHEVAGSPIEIAKIYHSPPSAVMVAKLQALVGMRTAELAGVAAWPTDLVLSANGKIAGFVMPKVDARGVIDRLSHPGERRQHFADADFLFLTTVAANVMAAAAVLHDRGVVIGDVNESNVMVRTNGTVAFIDVDSFQVSIRGALHRCGVAKDLFLPPELIGRDLSTVSRTPVQDCFGLAVLVFQLLMHGRHPFHGCTLDGVDRSTQELAAAGAYAYSASPRLRIRPPPGTLPVSAFGRLSSLFERAFLSSARPTAAEWSTELRRFRDGLRPCKANRRHALFPGQGACAHCALPRDPLPAPFEADLGASPDVASIRHMLAEIARMSTHASTTAASSAPAVSAIERECPTRPGEPPPATVAGAKQLEFPNGLTLTIVLCSFVLVALALATGASGATIICGLVWGLLVFALASKASAWASAAQYRRFVTTYDARKDAIRQELATLEAAERSASEFDGRQPSLSHRIQRLRDTAAGIASAEARQAADLSATAARRYRERWVEEQMSAFLIGPAIIPGIGQERKRVLASHGIETAADVTLNDVAQVPGFGPKLTESMLDWRAKCAQVVAKRVAPPMPPRFIESLRRDHAIAFVKSAEGIRGEYIAIRQALRDHESAARMHRDAVTAARIAFREARTRALAIDRT
jgi:DNA-binding helix-hairpin-helix protein with protein kinase domain